jgi:hypothetical protein
LSGERKERKNSIIDHWRQSNNYLSACATPYGKGYGCASKETMDDQIWLSESVTHVLNGTGVTHSFGKKRKAKKISCKKMRN